jgi:AcrR family transcriptional regulator
MRVTPETKAATRQAILAVARRLFAENGFERTTTRDIARAAGLATGTLFNYFATKEALLSYLAAEASAEAIARIAAGPAGPPETPEEDFFALVAATLRALKPLRNYLPALLETALSPLAAATQAEGDSLRTRHLEAAAAVAARHGHPDLSPVALQLYWTLYTGVLVFWANDASPRQEDTLALVDESLDMYVAWLRGSRPADPAPTEKEPPCRRSQN